MNDAELKSMIEAILQDVVAGKNSNVTGATSGVDMQSTPKESKSVVEDAYIPDLSELDIKKELYVDNPHDKEGYLKMKSFTQARLGCGRCGTRYKTKSILRFRADHAAAQDAVFSDVDPKLVEEMGFVPLQTVCKTKDEYITRPDHGRIFDDVMAKKLQIIRKKVRRL